MAIPGLQFPTAIDTDSSLFVAANNFGTLLTSTITNLTTNITLDSVVGLPPSGFVTIENEVVYYPSISGNTLQSCDRGVDGTTAVGHNAGVAISHYVIAIHHNRLKDAVIAIQAALGINLANVVKPPSLFPAGFAGDGSDGDVVISVNTDISETVKQYNNLTINAGVTLTAKNAVIGVKGTLTVNGTISAIGGGLVGAAAPTSDFSVGNAGTSLDIYYRNYSVAGGGGGAGSDSYQGGAGGTSGGAGGAAGATNASGSAGSAASAFQREFIYINNFLLWQKGAGGGSGSRGSSSNIGGAGGAGGGFLYIECDELVFNTGSIITAAGAAGSNGSGSAPGGGGGGGGMVVVAARTITTNNGTISVAGGAGGTGWNGGVINGGAGGAGHALIIDV